MLMSWARPRLAMMRLALARVHYTGAVTRGHCGRRALVRHIAAIASAPRVRHNDHETHRHSRIKLPLPATLRRGPNTADRAEFDEMTAGGAGAYRRSTPARPRRRVPPTLGGAEAQARGVVGREGMGLAPHERT